MLIGGFQKLTLLDYPGQIACIIFTSGCNFCCPFCHNAGLVLPGDADAAADCVPEAEVLAYLKQRQGLLDGVVVSGGEPLLHPDIAEFIRKIKRLGYLVKLDTNGSYPERLENLLRENLLDYAAMDVKHRRECYDAAIGRPCGEILPKIERSTALLKNSGIPVEFRTTLVKGIHTEEDPAAIAGWIATDRPYYLQSYVDSGDVILPADLSAFPEEILHKMRLEARKYCPNTELRGNKK